MAAALRAAAQSASDFDAGPLSWVQGEIDHALARGLDALASFVAHPRDLTHLRQARMHVHQAAGAMQIVGLDGVVAYMDELERQLAHLEDMAEGDVPAASEHVERGCRKLQIFLRDVVNGMPPVPLKLFPEYESMQRVRGVRASSPTDLFHPDLERDGARGRRAAPVAPKPHSHLVRQRRQYQTGLLEWLRGEEIGARHMRDAIAAIEESTSSGTLRTFWWTTRALHDSLIEGGLDASFGVKQLAARIDLQIRRLVEGGGKVADRLRREVLYYVAISAPVAPSVVDVQDTFNLAGLIPSPEVLHEDLVRIQPHVRDGREQLGHAKDAWLKLTSGRAENLPQLRETLATVHRHASELGNPSLVRLVEGLRSRLDQMSGTAIPETVAMEFATALLLAENAFGNPAALPARFAGDVDTMLARLDAARESRVLESGAPAPAVDEMSRRAQERLLLAQVGREIQSNLRHMEQVLDAFFRDHTRRAELATLARDSAQIRGALRMLGLDRAAELLASCQQQIDGYADPATPVTDEALELLAESLSGLGFYVEAVEQQRADHERLIEPLLAKRRGEAHAPAAAAETSVEADVAHAQAELPDLVAACDAGKHDGAARATLKARLTELGDDARLIGDDELAGQARTALRELDAGAAPAAAVAAIIGSGSPPPPLPLTEETQRILAAHGSAVDDEILDIFITEACEVLETVGEQFRLLTINPGDREALRTSRRQFHTLKGSGRMVGLAELGEIALAVEKIHNRLLEEDRPVTPAVLAMIGAGESGFRTWVGQLAAEGRVHPDPAHVYEAIAAVERELPGPRDVAAAPSQPKLELVHDAAPAPQPTIEPAHEAAPAPEPTSERVHEAAAAPQPPFELARDMAAAPEPPFDAAPDAGPQPARGLAPASIDDGLPAIVTPEVAITAAHDERAVMDATAADYPMALEPEPPAPVEAEPVDLAQLLATGQIEEAAAELEAALARDLDALADLREIRAPGDAGAVADFRLDADDEPALPDITAAAEPSIELPGLGAAVPQPPTIIELFALQSEQAIAVRADLPAPLDIAAEPPQALDTSVGQPTRSDERASSAAHVDPSEPLAVASDAKAGPAHDAWADAPVIEPVIDEPVMDEAVMDEPAVDQPILDEAIDEPVVDAGTAHEPSPGDETVEGLPAGASTSPEVPSAEPPVPALPLREAIVIELPVVAHAAARAREQQAREERERQREIPGDATTDAVDGEAAQASDDIAVGDVWLSRSLYEILVAEADGHLDLLAHELALMQFDPSHPPGDDMVRASHTLCGIHRTAGFPVIAETAKALEYCLAALQDSPLPLSAAAQPVIARAVSGIAGFVGKVKARRAFGPADTAEAEAIQRELEALRVEAVLRAHPPPLPVPAAGDVDAKTAVGHEADAAAPVSGSETRFDEIRDDVDEQLVPIFLEEAEELFPHAGEELRAWRRNPPDASHALALRRTLHTFKGSARMAGAMRLGELTHRMESRLLDGDAVKVGTNELFDALDADLDRVAFVLDALREGRTDVALPWGDELADAADAARSTSDDTASQGAPVVVPLAGTPARAPDVATASVEADSAQRAVLRVRADVVDRLVNEAGEVAIARARIEGELRTLKASLLELTTSVIRMRSQVREIEIQAESQIQSRLSMRNDVNPDFDPLEFDRFTRFQELTRSLAEGVNDVSTVQQSLLRNLDETDAALVAQARLSRDMQQQLLSMRTVPFGSLAERLYRILRQVAKELDKRVNLDIQGAQVELDRSVLEKLAGPLEHLLRNALDHGIESREAREQAGKSPTGQVVVVARQVGNEILLELTDDGAGLDLERIRQRAVAQGRLAPDARPSDAQLVDCIFEAGFSTATRVTAVSGRGIGMDVVRSDIAALGGRVEVVTRPGAGTTFMLYLPLTLAVAQAVLVRAGGRLWALPAPMVEQVQQIKAEELLQLYGVRAIEWQGRSYPLHYLPRLLGDTQHVPVTGRFNPVLLLRTGQGTAAVHVDEMVGNQEVVVKNIGPQLARVSGIAGATVLGTGEIVLIINPVQLAQRGNVPAFDPHAEARVAQAGRPIEQAGPPVVLVVDDSLTVRKITTRMLTREGFEVLTAKDGVDALQVMTERMPDVLLLDIEMPRMDGFELTKMLKADPRLAHVPIVMITSRTAEKHRNRARELGVDLYLGKPYQEEELLRHLREMLAVAV